MLYKETTESWSGLGAPTATTAVLNTDKIINLKARGSKSSFEYSLDSADRRKKLTLVWGTTSVAAIKISFDSALTSRVMALSVYPDDDITQTPVAKNINYKDFIYAYAYDSTRSWVVYNEGRVIVNNTLDELVTAAYGP